MIGPQPIRREGRVREHQVADPAAHRGSAWMSGAGQKRPGELLGSRLWQLGCATLIFLRVDLAVGQAVVEDLTGRHARVRPVFAGYTGELASIREPHKHWG